MISAALAVLKTDEQRNELSEFYEENKSRLYSIAFERLHNRQDAEDAIQETFLGIATKPDKFFSLTKNEKIYHAAAIVRNISVDIYKKRAKHQTDEISEDIIYQSDEQLLENSLLEKISHDELLDFINNLPVLQRNVLMLTCLSELSISETADVLKISKNAVNQRLYLARKSIRAFIEERNNE